jgi:hypothetical protein
MVKNGRLKNYPMNGLPISIKEIHQINKLIKKYKQKKIIK